MSTSATSVLSPLAEQIATARRNIRVTEANLAAARDSVTRRVLERVLAEHRLTLAELTAVERSDAARPPPNTSHP